MWRGSCLRTGWLKGCDVVATPSSYRPTTRPQVGVGLQKPGSVSFSFQVTGVQEVARALRRIPDAPDLVRRLRAANKEGSDLFVPAIRSRTPVGTTAKTTKRLRDTVRSTASRTGARLLIGGKKQYYAWMIHHGYHPGGGRTKVKGRPFVREGISAKYAEFIKLYPKALQPVIDEFNRRYGPVNRFNRLSAPARRHVIQRGSRR